MIAEAENELLTRAAPGTPAGEMMRRYWQPAALSEELPPGGAPVPVKLLGEELVAFRDGQGRPGLLGLHCSHRGADLSYGRLEDGGLRCIYHGWLYDIQGNCLDQPGEPTGSTFHQRIHHVAYPCQERSGIIFAYLGPGDPPQFPNYEFFTVPPDHVHASKIFSECNFLQGNEGNIDLIHLSFLHHNRWRDAGGTEQAFDVFNGRGAAPHVERNEAEILPFGVRSCKIRETGEGKHLYMGTFILPAFFTYPSPSDWEGYSFNWHVPIDDTSHWKYVLTFDRSHPIDPEFRARRYSTEATSDYMPTRTRANHFLQNREELKTDTYTGLAFAFQAQDRCVTEGAGPIQDRTQEHLATSDMALVAARKLYQKAIRDVQEGRDPPGVIRDPEMNHFPYVLVYTGTAPKGTAWKAFFREMDARVSCGEPVGALRVNYAAVS